MQQQAKFNERTSCISCKSNDLDELSSGKFEEGLVKRFINADPWGEHPAPFLKGNKWSFVSCNECGQTFHRYILSPKWNKRKNSKWMSQKAIEKFNADNVPPEAEFNTAMSNTAHVLQIEKLTREIRNDNPVRVLDFGCGYGEFLSMCSIYGYEAYGVDQSTAKLENNSYDKVYPEIKAITHLAPFHVITLFETLGHLDNPIDTMLKLDKLLIKGGVLILEVPNCEGVEDITTMSDYRNIHPLENINAFTPESLKNFAVNLGYKRIPLPMTCVASGKLKVAKKVVRNIVGPALKDYTRMYFRKL